MTRALAWATAWFTPAAILAWILWASGQNPAVAVAYGWTGIAGAAGYVIVHWLAERRRRRAFDEDVAQAWLSTPHGGPSPTARLWCCEAGTRAHPDPCPWHPDAPAVYARLGEEIAHEGLARMHLDIARDAERRRDE